MTMLDTLQAAGPHPALADKLALYGRFVGTWALDIEQTNFDGTLYRDEGEWRFAWVLEGRAIQDVWIFPARHRHAGTAIPGGYRYGTTFRWYDPSIDAWHITWFDPTRPVEVRQIGRAAGDDIVQVGEDHHGVLRRWRFTDITPDGFRWLGDISWDKGAGWTRQVEMRARRV